MIIYKVTNLVNGKIYIGRTISTLKKRKLSHYGIAYDSRVGPGTNCPFYKALREFGKRNFKWEVLDKSLFQETLVILEAYYIKKFNSKYPNGYNGRHGDQPTKLSPFAFGRQNLSWDKISEYYEKDRMESGYQDGLNGQPCMNDSIYDTAYLDGYEKGKMEALHK